MSSFALARRPLYRVGSEEDGRFESRAFAMMMMLVVVVTVAVAVVVLLAA